MPRLRMAINIGRRSHKAQIVHNHRLIKTVEEHLTTNVNVKNKWQTHMQMRIQSNTIKVFVLIY